MHPLSLCPLVTVRSIKDNGDIIGDNDLIFDTSYQFGGTAAPAGTSSMPRPTTVYCSVLTCGQPGTTIVFIVSDFSGQSASTAPITVSNSCEWCSGPICSDPGWR